MPPKYPPPIRQTLDFNLLPGDRCWVNNYRRTSDPWEEGEVIGLRSGSFFTRERYSEGDVPLCRFQYRVRLDRLSAAGNVVFVTVGEKDIETTEEDRDSIIHVKAES